MIYSGGAMPPFYLENEYTFMLVIDGRRLWIRN